MRIVQINGGVFGSTGKIMGGIKKLLESHGHEVMCASPVTSTNRDHQPDYPYIRIGSFLSRRISVFFCQLTGLREFAAPLSTFRLIGRIKRFHPDLIQLHTVHGDYINLPMLFRFIKKHQIRVVWTLHDCWAFTGHCTHFEQQGCEKWRDGCHHCPLYRRYPRCAYDDSGRMYRKKKAWFTGADDLVIATPSAWLAGYVRESFLGAYEVKVIHNGIDLAAFSPTQSSFRADYGLEDKTVLLGVSFKWDEKKGLDVFIRLRELLDDTYAIILVGTDDDIDSRLPEGIISIHRTQDQTELAQLYACADVFVNPTREEVFGMVNAEAIACGTPVVTFRTGGAAEMLTERTGLAVEKDDVEALLQAIKVMGRKTESARESCLTSAQSFDESIIYQQYEEIYQSWNRSVEKN